MSERKVTNKYYPPDYDPSKGSINKILGQHPLRERARKIDQGILVIRFEAPYNMWCLGCNKHIAKGVRFNAEKKAVGQYHTTKIWEFSMKCAGCSHQIVIRTDPKKCEYVVTSGARAKIESYNAEEIGTYEFLDNDEREKVRANPLLKLDHEARDKEKASHEINRIRQLEHLTAVTKDDFALSQMMRKKLRSKRKATRQLDEERKRKGLSFPLLPFSQSDIDATKVVSFAPLRSFDVSKKSIRTRINKMPLFSTSLSCVESEKGKKRKALLIKYDHLIQNMKKTHK